MTTFVRVSSRGLSQVKMRQPWTASLASGFGKLLHNPLGCRQSIYPSGTKDIVRSGYTQIDCRSLEGSFYLGRAEFEVGL